MIIWMEKKRREGGGGELTPHNPLQLKKGFVGIRPRGNWWITCDFTQQTPNRSMMNSFCWPSATVSALPKRAQAQVRFFALLDISAPFRISLEWSRTCRKRNYPICVSVPYGVVGEHTRLSRGRPGFKSRWGSFVFFFFWNKLKHFWICSQ